MKVKHASDGYRYGDTNKEHTLAIKRVIDFWSKCCYKLDREWIIDQTWIEQYSAAFQLENKMLKSGRDHFFHCPDLVLFEWFEDRPILKLVIEIDGESHGSKSRKIADGLFQKWINQRYGDVPLIRLKKEELVGDLDLAVEYLQKELKEYI